LICEDLLQQVNDNFFFNCSPDMKLVFMDMGLKHKSIAVEESRFTAPRKALQAELEVGRDGIPVHF
jgi:hypothetical protein